VLSMRERMVQHRSNPACASCHAVMDPPGLSLEGFDAVGRRRTLDDAYEPIDLSGVLPDGTKYVGVAGLRQALLARSDQFVTTITEKLLTYALGRGLEDYDIETVDQIVARIEQAGGRSSALLAGIIESAPFQKTRKPST